MAGIVLTGGLRPSDGVLKVIKTMRIPVLLAKLDSYRVASRVHGYVALGSIERDVPAKQVRFRVVNAPPHAGGPPGTPLEVVFTSLETPDLFKDGAEVVVEGRLASAGGVFHADKVLAKCPSKFESAPGTQRGT